MNNSYVRQWVVTISPQAISGILNDCDKILRLAPQWDVKVLCVKERSESEQRFDLDVEYDRVENQVSFSGRLLTSSPLGHVRIILTSATHSLDFSMEVTSHPHGKIVSIRIESTPEPDVSDLREFDLWARSILNYMKIADSRFLLIRMWKIFLDRWWLNMTQSAKRITFFVVISEGFSLVFLVALLLWWKFFSTP
jgi:hypothetical protein